MKSHKPLFETRYGRGKRKTPLTPTTIAARPRHTWTASVGRLFSPYRLLIRTSLVLGVAAGFSLGLYLLLGFAFGWPLSAGTPALMQVHGQIQVFGFLVMFIMTVGVQLFPRFHASRLDRPAQVSGGALLLATGVVLRAIAQLLAVDAASRPAVLLLSGFFTLVGVGLVVHAFARVIRGGVEPAPSGWRALLPSTLGASLILALVLNFATCVELAQGALVVPFAHDEALIEHGAAAVMMASHGRTGIVRTILGSVAGQTLHHSPCPVLLIRPATLRPIEEPLPSQAEGIRMIVA